MWAPLGALLLTILAAAALLAAALRDPGMRVRDEIADAIGSPVFAAARSRPQHSVAGWSTLFETYEPTPVESGRFVMSSAVWHPQTAMASRGLQGECTIHIR